MTSEQAEKIKLIELLRVTETNRILDEETTDISERIAGLHSACDKAIAGILREGQEIALEE